MNRFTILIYIGFFLISSVYSFHGRIILRKDGSVDTQGFNHTNFNRKCSVNDYCEFTMTAAAFQKSEYDPINANLTDGTGIISTVASELQKDNEGWQGFVSGDFNTTLEEIKTMLTEVQEIVDNTTSILDMLDRQLTNAESKVEVIQISLETSPTCYLTAWDTCTATTTPPTTPSVSTTMNVGTTSITGNSGSSQHSGSTTTNPSVPTSSQSSTSGATTTTEASQSTSKSTAEPAGGE